MARPKEFDPGQATREAMEAFWENGYSATSVSDLLSEMKLNRGSLYGTFGDKKQLFLAALDEYERQGREGFRQALDRPGSAKAAIREWFAAAARGCAGEPGRRGCLAAKAAMEVAPHDADVAGWLKRFHRHNESLIAATIARAQGAGEIRADLDPDAAARFLLSVLGGLHLLGSTSPSLDQVDGVLKIVFDALGLN